MEEREREKKIGEEVRDTTFGGDRSSVSDSEGSQAEPVCPSGRGNAYDGNSFYDVGRSPLY
jgi:hypothetical protein